MAMKWDEFIESAKLDPARFYRDPTDVVRDRRLTDEERLEILSAWERDARALSVAADENMTGGEPSRLSQVVEMRIKVEERVGHVSSAHGNGNDKAHGRY